MPEPLLRNPTGVADLPEDSSIPKCSTMRRGVLFSRRLLLEFCRTSLAMVSNEQQGQDNMNTHVQEILEKRKRSMVQFTKVTVEKTILAISNSNKQTPLDLLPMSK